MHRQQATDKALIHFLPTKVRRSSPSTDDKPDSQSEVNFDLWKIFLHVNRVQNIYMKELGPVVLPWAIDEGG